MGLLLGNTFLVLTDTASFNDHAWITPWRKTLEFEVTACEDARLLLGSVPGQRYDQYAHEIHLGGWDNTQSAIHRGAQVNMVHTRGHTWKSLKRFLRFIIA